MEGLSDADFIIYMSDLLDYQPYRDRAFEVANRLRTLEELANALGDNVE